MEKIIARRYGEALFAVAKEKGLIEEIKVDVQELLDLLQQDDQLLQYMNHPKIKREDKQETIEKMFKDQLSHDMIGLLFILLKKNRQDHLVPVLEYYLEEYKVYNKLSTVYVRSAVTLSDEQKSKLKEKIETSRDEKVDMEFDLDESLIGGLVIRIGDQVIDNSVRGKLDDLTRSLRQLQLS